MTVADNSTFARVEPLPFADGKFETVPRISECISFNLAKTNRRVTLLTGHAPEEFPRALLERAHQEFNYVVEEGRTYPHYKPFTYEEFLEYAFACFFAILVQGEYSRGSDGALISELHDSGNGLAQQPRSFWDEQFLGSFYIKPNYIGRCSHVCNAGFIVNHAKRGMGLGKEMGQKYLTLAPRLGFVYSVFNLVFETNVASLRIWDSLGFERIGYVKNVAVLKGESKLTGAVMFGKDLV